MKKIITTIMALSLASCTTLDRLGARTVDRIVDGDKAMLKQEARDEVHIAVRPIMEQLKFITLRVDLIKDEFFKKMKIIDTRLKNINDLPRCQCHIQKKVFLTPNKRYKNESSSILSSPSVYQL